MDQMAQQTAMPEEEMAEAPEQEAQEEQSLGSATKQIKVPPNLQEAYQKVVIAGMKVMYSPQTKKLMDDELNSDKPMPQKLSESIAGLMFILWKKSNESMPPQLIIPAAMALLVEAAEFLQDAGQEVNPNDVAEASTLVVKIIMEKFGATPEQIQQLFGGGLNQEAALQAGQEQKQGLVAGAMQGEQP